MLYSSAWALSQAERLVDVLDGFGVGVVGGVPVVETDHEVTRFGDAGVERFTGLGQSAYPAAAVYVDEDGRFDRRIAVAAHVYVEIEAGFFGAEVHEPLGLHQARALDIEHGEEAQELVFGVTRPHIGKFQVVDEFLAEAPDLFHGAGAQIAVFCRDVLHTLIIQHAARDCNRVRRRAGRWEVAGERFLLLRAGARGVIIVLWDKRLPLTISEIWAGFRCPTAAG